MTKKVLITDYVWPSVEPERKVLEAAGIKLVVAPSGDENTLVELSKDVDAIMTCFAKVTESVINAAKNCLVISRYGVGVDNIDVNTATNLGIAVTYVPDYCIPEVSDHVIALMLDWNRRLTFFDRATKTQGWGSEGLNMRIMRLEGKNLGIIGFGRIGRGVADKATAFGMNILTSDPFVTQESAAENGAHLVTTEELLKNADFVTIHSPLIPETENIICPNELGLMKKDSFLINCARGGLIDEDALYKALVSGSIAGAGLDVLVDIDPPLDHKIIQLENVIVTPHTAFFSQEAVLELEERAAGEVVNVLSGKMPDNLVNPAVLNHSRIALV